MYDIMELNKENACYYPKFFFFYGWSATLIRYRKSVTYSVLCLFTYTYVLQSRCI